MILQVSHKSRWFETHAKVNANFTDHEKIENQFPVDRKKKIHKSRSLRSSRFLSFSKRSRTGGKLRKSGKISSTSGVLLRSPAFRSLVRSPRRLKKERNRLLRRLQITEKINPHSRLTQSKNDHSRVTKKV